MGGICSADPSASSRGEVLMKRSFLRSIVLTVCALALTPPCGFAQDHPKVEGYIGYSNLTFDRRVDHINLSGWNASIVGNVNHWFAIEGDGSGFYRGGGNLHTAMGGVRFTYRNGRVN